MSSLRINISGLSEGRHTYALHCPAGEIGLDERFTGSVDVSVELEKTHRDIFLNARVQSEGQFTCDRCLEDFRRLIEATYEQVYLLSSKEQPRSADQDVEVVTLSSETNIIDIGEDARQFLLLKLPIKMLCKEDCAGLCPSCGTNLNRSSCDCSMEETDPRWEALKNLGKN